MQAWRGNEDRITSSKAAFVFSIRVFSVTTHRDLPPHLACRTKVTLIMIKLVRILKPRAVGLAIAHHAPAVMHIARNRARSDHRGPREQLPTLRQRGLARLANSTAGPKVSIRAGRGVVG